MILTAHQPVYLPWLGLFHKIALSEKYCIFDIAQYQTKDFNNRNKIKTNSGPIWLSVPVESKDHLDKKLCDIKIINNGWNKKHFKSIDLAYKKSKFYKDYISKIEEILLKKEYTYLKDLNYDFLAFGLREFDIKKEIVVASDFDFKGAKSDLVLDMCIQLEASKYIFGSQGKNYANEQSFFDKGIEIYFQDYVHPVYQQLHGEFEPYMSFVDLLFNHGEDSKRIMMLNNITEIN